MNPASPFGPGVVVDGFTLVRELGRGGMGSVWEVERGGARYALKTATVSNDPELALRFQREAQAQARVDRHPNVVGVHSAGVWGGAPYLIMDLAPGGDLETRLQGGPLPWREAARLAADLARGLAHVHAQGASSGLSRPPLALGLALGVLPGGVGGAILARGSGAAPARGTSSAGSSPAPTSTTAPQAGPHSPPASDVWSARGSQAELQERVDRSFTTWATDPGAVLEAGDRVEALALALRAACPTPPSRADLGRLGRLVLILRYVKPPRQALPLLAELDAWTKESPELVADVFPLAQECGAPWLEFLAALVGPRRDHQLPTIRAAMARVDRHQVRPCLEYLVLRGPLRVMAWRQLAAFHANGGPLHLPLLERSLQHFLTLSPEHTWGLVMLGTVRRARGEVAQARELFERVSQTLCPEKSLAVFWQAQLACDQGELDVAHEALLFSKSLAEENELYPVHKTMSYWRLYYQVQTSRRNGAGVALASKMLQQVTRYD